MDEPPATPVSPHLVVKIIGAVGDEQLQAVARLLAAAVEADLATLPGNGGTSCEATACHDLATAAIEIDGCLTHLCSRHAEV